MKSLHCRPHGSQINDGRHAGEVLQHNSRRLEGNFDRGGALGVGPSGERFDVVFGDECHLQVELGEFGLPVGPLRFIAKATSDLKVAVET